MAGFPSRFGTGMSPMGGLQPTNPTPTLPPLQTPAGNAAPPVGAPIPLSTGKTPGVVGYGGSSAGRDNFSKYLQKMNTSAPLAMNRGGPVKMREGGMVQQQGFLPPMDLSRPARPPLFGGVMHMGPKMGGLGGGGISGALEPLKNYITTQVQQQNNEKIGPFVDGIVQNVEQEFGLQSGGGMTAQPAITTQMPSLGLAYGNFPMPALNRVPFQGRPNLMSFAGLRDTRITPRGGFDSPFRGRALGYAEGGAVSDLDDFDFIQDEIQADIDAQIEEQQRSDDADERERNQAEAALRAATEQRIAAQFPSADEIEIMNTAGYDKEPTSYPTAGRDSYAGFGGGQLFSNRGGLEQPFDRTNRQMTNLGSPLSDYINNESAEGTFADSDVIDSIDLSGAKGSAAGAATLPAGFSGGLEDNAGISKAMTEAQRKAFLGPDPVSARNSLAKKMQNLNDMAFLRSELGLPVKTGIGSSADEFIGAMGDRFGTDFSLTSDQLYPATQEFKSRSISPFDFDRSSLDNLGNVIESSGSSALTSGPLGGDPFKPLRGAGIGGSSQGIPDNLVPTLDSYGTRAFNAFGEGVTPGAPVGTFDFPPTDEQITDRGFVPTNIAQPAISVTEVSPPEEVDFMFGTEDLANQTPTPTGFGFDDDEELRDSSVMYRDMSLDELEQLSLDGDEGASQAIRDRFDDINARELDAFERDRASKGFSTRPATSMAPPRDDARVFPTPSPLVGGPLDSEDAGFDVFATDTRADRPTGGGISAQTPVTDVPGFLDSGQANVSATQTPGFLDSAGAPLFTNEPEEFSSLVDDFGRVGFPLEERKTVPFTNEPEEFSSLVDDFGPITGFPVTDKGTGIGPEATYEPEEFSSLVDDFGRITGFPTEFDKYSAFPDDDEELRDSSVSQFAQPVGPEGVSSPIALGDFDNFDQGEGAMATREGSIFGAIDEINDDLYEDEKDFEIVPFDLDNIVKDVQTGVFSEGFEFPDDEAIKLEKLFASATGNTKEVIEAIEADTNDKLYYEALDGLGKGNYKEETREELIKRLRDGERNQGWVRDIVSTVSKAHPVLFLVDKLMIKLTQKDMKEQADLLDGKGLKDGQTAEAVRIQKGRHKGKYVGVVIKEGDKIVEYKGHKVMPNQFDNKDPLYDYILDDTFKPGPDDDDSPVVDDPCPPGFVLSGGVCVPIQSVGEDEEDVVEEDTTTDDTPDTTETLDEIMARITNPSRTPSNPTETLRPITFANKGGEMKVDPLAGGAIQDSLASATQRFLNSLTG